MFVLYIQSVSKEQIVALKRTVETSAQMITRLENDLDARSAALEASVAAAAGVPHLRSASTGSLNQHHQYQHGGSSSYSTTNPPLDLAALLGVQDHPAALPTAHAGTTTTTAAGAVVGGGGNNQINVQMISILQSQRDQYKDKLTRVRNSINNSCIITMLTPCYLVLCTSMFSQKKICIICLNLPYLHSNRV